MSELPSPCQSGQPYKQAMPSPGQSIQHYKQAMPSPGQPIQPYIQAVPSPGQQSRSPSRPGSVNSILQVTQQSRNSPLESSPQTAEKGMCGVHVFFG